MSSDFSNWRGVATIASVRPPSGSETPSAVGETSQVGGWLAELAPTSHPLVVPLRRHLSRSRQIVDTVHEFDDSWRDWSWQANAVWIDDAQRLIFDPTGRLLFDARQVADANHSDPDAVIPSSLDARRRQAEIATELRNRLVDPVEGLIPLPGQEEVSPREPSEVARRILALFLVATRAESIMAGEPLDTDRMRQRCPIGFDALSDQERVFFSKMDAPASEQLVWRYESLLALQWALGMQFELAWPDEHADLTAVTRLMVDLPDQAIVDQARLRSVGELLSTAERHHQLYYCVAMAQTQNLEPPAGISGGVVCERLIALSWLLGLAGDWDQTVHWVENGMVE